MRINQNLQRLLIAACFLVFGQLSYGQDSTTRFASKGMITGVGWRINIDPRYTPYYFKGDFSWQFAKGPRKKFLAFYLEPQFNLVSSDDPMDIEYGVNIGVRYYQRLSSGFYLYQMLGSGPHYISAVLPRQANGFIFSDNLAVGFLKQLNTAKSLFLNFQFIVRHISNAGFKLPNSGVNKLNILIGLSRVRS